MPYMIRGTVRHNGDNYGRVGKTTYLAETGDHFYIWDGAHKGAHFETPEAGFKAAARCNGPWFNMPDPTTVECVDYLEVDESVRAGLTGW